MLSTVVQRETIETTSVVRDRFENGAKKNCKKTVGTQAIFF